MFRTRDLEGFLKVFTFAKKRALETDHGVETIVPPVITPVITPVLAPEPRGGRRADSERDGARGANVLARTPWPKS